MNCNVSIRNYTSSDYTDVIHFWEPLGLGNTQRGDTADVIEKTIALGGKFFILIDNSTTQLIGTSWLTNDGRRIYIHHFGIAEDYQNKGLATFLLKYSLQEASKSGMQIKLEVHKDNAKAIHLYEKAGFAYLGDYGVYIIRDVSSI